MALFRELALDAEGRVGCGPAGHVGLSEHAESSSSASI
jgi:hypothetical protein